jgi:hypothetical protein
MKRLAAERELSAIHQREYAEHLLAQLDAK